MSHSLFFELEEHFFGEKAHLLKYELGRGTSDRQFKLEFDLQDFVRMWINAIELLENFVIDFGQLGAVNFCQSRSLASKFIIKMNSFHILKKKYYHPNFKTLKFDLRV